MNDRMHGMRTALFSASAGIVVVLAAAAATSVAPPPTPAAPVPTASPSTTAPVVVETGRLRERQTREGARIVVQRNLFTFSSAPGAKAPVARAREVIASAPEAQPVPPRVPWALIGIASDEAIVGGRIAILSKPGALQFVRAGDVLAEDLEVAAVGDESVELRGEDDRLVVLRLSK